MNTFALFFMVMIIILIELVPMIKKKQSREAFVLLTLGVITFAYGYYYSTHRYTASLVITIFELLNFK